MKSSIEPNPLAENEKYERQQTLGQGSFGFVQLAKNLQTGELAAIKFLKRGAINKYTEAEILNHSLLRHPHVIQFKEVFLTSEHICIAMEYATGGSLFHYVQKQGRLREAVARWFFQQLVIGADYCHKRGVANRDIKLENTLLQMVKGLPLPLLKICDFGYSKADSMSVAKSKVGTLTYMAPEVLVNRDGKYNGKVADIWSCGVMLYVMLYGRYPFDSPPGQNVPKATEILQMLDKMVGQKYAMPETVEVSAEGKDLLQRMLFPDPTQRIQLEQIMLHPWFTTNLPPEAATMNESYLRALYPPGHQKVEEIHRLLEEAKMPAGGRGGGGHASSSHAASASAGAGAGAGAVTGAQSETDILNRIVDSAMKDDLRDYGGEPGSGAIQEFIKAHASAGGLGQMSIN